MYGITFDSTYHSFSGLRHRVQLFVNLFSLSKQSGLYENYIKENEKLFIEIIHNK
jgi:hypothetical protein